MDTMAMNKLERRKLTGGTGREGVRPCQGTHRSREAVGLVLFNRFYQPDLDLESLTISNG